MCSYRWCLFTPYPVHKSRSLLFSLFKIKAPDTRSRLTWVILQPLTFPSLKQAQACTLIDPAGGLGANLPWERQEVTVFHCSIQCNYPQNKHILDSSWPSQERRWVGGLFVHLHMPVCLQLFINQLDTINKTCPEQGITEKCVRSGNNKAPLPPKPFMSHKVKHPQCNFTCRHFTTYFLINSTSHTW